MVGKAGRHGKRLDNGARRGADFGHMEQMAGAATEYPTLLGSYGGGKQSGQKSKETLQIDNDTEEGPAASEAMRKAPISMLQEFVQCAKEFRIPSRRPILTWSFETRMEGAATLEFRATATFLLGGVPHHSAGMWHHSKKSAQRDAAERALGFFVGKWGEQLLEQQHPPLMDKSGSVSSALSASSCRSSSDSMWPPPPKAHCILHEPISPLAAHMTYDDATFSSSVYSDSSQDGNRQWSSADTEASHSPRVYVQHHVAHDVQHHVAHQPTDCDILFQACRDLQACDDAPPEWRMSYENGGCTALVEVELLGVLHKFSGLPCETEDEARKQTARRLLWYFQYPGYEDQFEPDLSAAIGATMVAPPAHWASDASEHEALQVAKRKTAVMRVQNRLQQALAHQLKPGQGVWEWSYESNQEDGGWPPMCKATVQVPAFGVEFTGDWVRGHRAAQLQACFHVERLLDRLDQGDAFVRAGGSRRHSNRA